MTHRFLIDIAPNTYAFLVVGGMAVTGLTLGTFFDKLLARLGIDVRGGPR